MPCPAIQTGLFARGTKDFFPEAFQAIAASTQNVFTQSGEWLGLADTFFFDHAELLL
jgi:hypothetical protein